MDAQAIMQRLQAIDEDLGRRQNEWETSAGDRARLVRDWEKRLATHRKIAKGPDADSRKASALVAAIEQDDLYERLTAAEGSFEALRAVIKVLETRTSIGQSILKAMGRA